MDSYRSVLEVLKWCSASEVLLHCREVTGRWAGAGLCNELWDHFSESCHFPPRHRLESGLEAYVRRKCQGSKLPLFLETQVVIYDCCSGLKEYWNGQTPPPRLSHWVYYADCIISTGGVSSCGNYGNFISSGAVYLYQQNYRSSLLSMQASRHRHAALVFQGELFVFGGIDGQSDLRSAEKLIVKSGPISRQKQWIQLPSSQPRKNFTLCCDMQHIYLCGSGVERFTPQTSIYSPVLLHLPFATCYNAVLLGKELLVLADSEAVWARLPLGSSPIRVQEIGEKRVQRSPANLVAVGLCLYWVAEKDIRKLDIAALLSRYED